MSHDIVSGFGHLWEFTEKWEIDSYLNVSGYLDDNIYPTNFDGSSKELRNSLYRDYK
jgi:hypothetical protein